MQTYKELRKQAYYLQPTYNFTLLLLYNFNETIVNTVRIWYKISVHIHKCIRMLLHFFLISRLGFSY